MLRNKLGISLILFVTALILFSFEGFGQNEPINTQPLLGRLGHIKKDTSSFVTDINYFTHVPPAVASSMIDSTYSQENIISLAIDEESQVKLPDSFRVSVTLKIEMFNAKQQFVDSIIKVLEVYYSSDTGANYKSVDAFRFTGAYQARMTVKDINTHGANWDVSSVLRLDNSISTQRYYNFECNHVVSDLSLTYNAVNGEGDITWADVNSGSTEYDLEWAWIEESAQAEYLLSNGKPDENKIFSSNSTRVTISQRQYSIPLLYNGNGYIYARVRRAKLTHDGTRNAGNWQFNNSAQSAVSINFNGHENELNWQSTTSYAEEGKRKSVVQYFDGSLRGRQTVTKDNQTGFTVVAESLYDFQGRPVIQILPAPTLLTAISYAKNFNRASGQPDYPKEMYDLIGSGSGICASPAPGLSTQSGAGQYYSASNPQSNSQLRNYIPNSTDANNAAYPFTESRFMPDGRLAYQSGVGPNHQIGSNHETKYFYESVAQPELDVLFGTDAGFASHYSKNIVKDANGQYSVSYLDMQGRTVATALAGDPPLSLKTLPSNSSLEISKNLIDDETNRVVGRSIISTKPLLVMKDGSYRFEYSLDPSKLQLVACKTQTEICYDCLYDLEIIIKPECNIILVPSTNPDLQIVIPTDGSGQYYKLFYSQLSLNPILNQPASCTIQNNPNLPNYRGIRKAFEIPNLKEGAYTITKTLTLSSTAQQNYRENVYIPKDICVELSTLVNSHLNVLQESSCAITCVGCTTALGTLANFRARAELAMGYSTSNPVPDSIAIEIEAAYNGALNNCLSICSNEQSDGMENIRSIRRLMLEDVSPPLGQYAKPGNYNVRYNIFRGGPKPYQYFQPPSNNLSLPAYQYPVKDQGAQPSFGKYYSITGQDNTPLNLSGLTPNNFEQQFDDAWAEQLLPHHPEYALLKRATTELPSSYKFEADIKKIDTWANALNFSPGTTSGQLITNTLNVDPFFSSVLGTSHPYYDEMQDKMLHYVTMNSNSQIPAGCTLPPNTPSSLSIWQMALGIVFCRNLNATNCDQQVLNCFKNFPGTPSTSFNQGCTVDRDKAWVAFRTMYLNERTKLLTKYLFDAPKNKFLQNGPTPIKISDDIIELAYTPRFLNLTGTAINSQSTLFEGLGIPRVEEELFNDMQSGNGDIGTQVQDLTTAMYTQTCNAYVSSWFAKLSECEVVAAVWNDPNHQIDKTNQQSWLKSLLVQICVKGADENHMSGASSLPNAVNISYPNTNNIQLRSFPDVIKEFFRLFYPSINQTATCNWYLINVPGPHGLQPSLSNATVITKPEPCECSRIQMIESEKNNFGFTGNVSQYLQYRYGVTMSMADYNTLKSLCNNTYACNFLAAPISLPRVFQCTGDNEQTGACISCLEYQGIKTAFQTEFGYSAPIQQPANEAEVRKNEAFARFANFRTGFAFDWYRYADFELLCDNFSDIPCDNLNATIQLFMQTSQYQQQQVGASCHNAMVAFLNNHYSLFYSYSTWLLKLRNCGIIPPCDPRVSCQQITTAINSFYATHGVGIYNQSNVINTFVTYINSQLSLNLSYSTIQAIYSNTCNCGSRLEITEQFNCFVLNRAYQSFLTLYPNASAQPNCRLLFEGYFADYFNLQNPLSLDEIEILYNNCFADGCGTDIKNICTPAVECIKLKEILSVYLESHGGHIPGGLNCQTEFLYYFNQHFQFVVPTFSELSDLYRKCGIRLDICHRRPSREKIEDYLTYFLEKIDHNADNCIQVFVDSFNTKFGIDLTFQDISDDYFIKSGKILNICRIPVIPTRCEMIQPIYEEYLSHYPDGPAQLNESCESEFVQMFNLQFNSTYNFAEIQLYYKNLCGITISICQSECNDKQVFLQDFLQRYQNISLSAKAKQQVFAFEYNKKYITGISSGAEPIFYYQIKEAFESCGYAEPIPDSVSPNISSQLLLGLKLSYYITHPQFEEDCEYLFTAWYNNALDTEISYNEIFELYESTCGINSGYICGVPDTGAVYVIRSVLTGITMPPVLCGLNAPVFPPAPQQTDACADLPNIALQAATEELELLEETKRNKFDVAYYNKCMNAGALESFKVTFNQSEYHHTLYYYDQAGNLIRTVPPNGVVKLLPADLPTVQTYRINVSKGLATEANARKVPVHKLVTHYRYNTLNQVVEQKTPDAGLSHFWYDILGRLVVSQNQQQQIDKKYSYTLYDQLGRIVEVGEKPQTIPPGNTRIKDDLAKWLQTNGTSNTLVYNKKQITRTYYDLAYSDNGNWFNTGNTPYFIQSNLRNRVSYTMLLDNEPDPAQNQPTLNYAHATFYSYDIHGNVGELVQDYKKALGSNNATRFKKMRYDYDLISGKVNKVSYQPGYPDQFYHLYHYDAENRITEVHTSLDGIIWETDARYSYYRHGPLARTVLGDLKVQGIDYAYTLQGWLKGVNSSAINDASHDMGNDGILTGGIAHPVARDAFSFSLNYFPGDYKPINTASAAVFAGGGHSLNTTSNSNVAKPLYNGNIASMFVNIPKLGQGALLYGYQYDQLNRLVSMNAFGGFNNISNSWTGGIPTELQYEAYKENISYDPNGNILSYLRNGKSTTPAMDNLTYSYYDNTNRLKKVDDLPANTGNYTEDIDNQTNSSNYTYDAIGNLTGDASEPILNIEWTVYGKIKKIVKSTQIANVPTQVTIEYEYDASGNRIYKKVDNKETIYVRDASGNVMAVYVKDPSINTGILTQNEVHLYGSSRLGVNNVNRRADDMTPVSPANQTTTAIIRGNKFFELCNHLGNVLVTVSDKKIAHYNANGVIDYYTADVVTANDYYPGGMTMPGRKYQVSSTSQYRYGFNGQMKSDEIGNDSYTAEFWQYDARIGRRWNVDPKPNISISPYAAFENNPIFNTDPKGDTTRGMDAKSAMRTQEAIVNIVDKISQKGCDKLSSYFKIGSDNVTFDKIDESAFNKDVEALGLNDDQKALVGGFVKAINDTKTHFIGIVKDGEKIDVSKIKNISKGSTELLQGIIAGKGGTGANFMNQSVAYMKYTQTASKGQFHPTNKAFAPPQGMILAHELLGHSLGEFYFNLQWEKKFTGNPRDYKAAPVIQVSKFSNLSGVQVYNLYFRVMGIKMEDQGEYHNRGTVPGSPPGPPMDATERNAIPAYLK